MGWYRPAEGNRHEARDVGWNTDEPNADGEDGTHNAESDWNNEANDIIVLIEFGHSVLVRWTLLNHWLAAAVASGGRRTANINGSMRPHACTDGRRTDSIIHVFRMKAELINVSACEFVSAECCVSQRSFYINILSTRSAKGCMNVFCCWADSCSSRLSGVCA